MRHVVCNLDEIAPGDMVATRVGKIPVVVVCTPSGQLCALADRCAHEGAALSRGVLSGTTDAAVAGEYRYVRDGEVLRCPWHCFEYDVKTGIALADPKVRVRTFQVTVEDDRIVVST